MEYYFPKKGVLSLAGVDNNTLLWAYYNSHTGFAIEFSDLPIDNKETFGPFPINYAKTFETLYPKSEVLPDEYLLYLTNIKASSWQHENEWRVLLRKDNLSIPNYPPSFSNDKNRLINYPKSMINSIILGYKFFKEFIPYEIDKKTYRFTVDENGNSKSLKLKLKFLKHLLQMNVNIKQVQTKDDNSFGIETNRITIEVEETNRIFVVTRLSEKRTPNLRFAHKPGDKL